MPGRSEDFARRQLMMDEETLHRHEEVTPFVVALVELPAGGYVIRVGQPRVIDTGRSTNPNLPLVSEIGPYGPGNYPQAAMRFNKLVDEDLK